MEVLLDNFPELKIVYDLKEEYLMFNESDNTDNVAEKLDRQIMLFADCGIPEYDEFYGLLCNWRQEFINSFSYADSKRINNSYIESKNRILERLISNAKGNLGKLNYLFTIYGQNTKAVRMKIHPNRTKPILEQHVPMIAIGNPLTTE